jgi:chaperonin GroEL (HSP60 family)
VRNAGKEPYSILDQMREARQDDAWIGWDAMTETIRDFGSGEMILDPIKVNKAALRAAASVVSTLIVTDVAILKR